jgi:tetratricopeptide (TPR) repeat protein
MRPEFLLLLVGLVAGCTSRDEVPVSADFAGATAGRYINLDPSVKYVGLEACVECHPVQAATYVESQMGRSFKPATRTASSADWSNPPAIYDPVHNLYYSPFAKGDSLFLREFRLSDGDTVYQRVEKIDYIVGSGQHTNSHMMEVNGYVYQIPITWYAQEGRWDLPPGFDEGHNWRFERAIELECMTCHNGMPGYYPGSDNRFMDLPHGINCERCHGPGEAHVVEKKAGKIVDTSKQPDWTIVNPAKLSRDLQLDVCQRCHLQGIAVTREGYTFADFRPGMRLGDVIDVYFPRYTDSLSQFIMASHPDRLRMSACRIPSSTQPGKLEPLPCITCHDPHVPVEAIGREGYNAPCKACHGGSDLTDSLSVAVVSSECSEDMEARLAVNDDCSTCHMPLSSSMDIPHVKITDHNIRVPDGARRAQDQVVADPSIDKTFVRLASLTDAQPSHRRLGEGYLAYYEQFNNVQQFLDSAAVRLSKARGSESDLRLAKPLVRLWYLQEDYEAIATFVRENPMESYGDAWTLYRIGEAFSNLGLHDRALGYYRKAVDQGPFHLWFRTKLASTHVALGEPEEAIAILDVVLEDNPVFHHAYNNRGYAYLLSGDYDRAESDFLTTLDLDPDYTLALANLASFYFNFGDPLRAKPFIDRLVELEPANRQYKEFKDAVDSALREADPQAAAIH